MLLQSSVSTVQDKVCELCSSYKIGAYSVWHNLLASSLCGVSNKPR